MAIQSKASITALLGALVGMLIVGGINNNYTIIGAIGGAFIGYALGSR